MKAEELIKGKWYEIPRCDMYIKFLYFTESRVIYNQTIFYRTSTFIDKEDWCDKKWDFQEVPISEIQPYLPENHPDKEFVLPKKWCIRGSDELGEWQSNIMDNKCDCYLNDKSYFYYLMNGINDLYHWNLRKDFPKDYTEITYEQFKKYVLKQENNNNMERKMRGAFCIKDFPNNRFGVHSKEYMGVDFIYNSEAWKDYNPTKYPEYWKIVYEEEFKVGDWVKIQSTKGEDLDKEIVKLTEFTPNNYIKFKYYDGIASHARLATPEEIAKHQTKELYFGDVKFTIRNGNDYADTQYGKVTKEEIKKAINYIENPPRLAGEYDLTIHVNGNYTCLNKQSTTSFEIGFGCKSGKLSELKVIYQAFE